MSQITPIGMGGLQLQQGPPCKKRAVTAKRFQACRALRDGNALIAAINPERLREITDERATLVLRNYKTTPVDVSGYASPVSTAFVGPRYAGAPEPQQPSEHPLLLLHGFDSSSVEFRALYPRLACHFDTYALDVLGSGFTEMGFYEDASVPLGPKQIREHLYNFWKKEIGRPVVLVGASLGGTMALDFALEYPSAVAKLVLLDAQGYLDGIGPISKGPRFVARLGAQALRTTYVREMAGKMSYHDPVQFATRDAMLVGRLHTFCEGWVDAKVAFIMSGGYQGIAKRLGDLKQPTLVLWGKQDTILDPKYASQFEADLPDARVMLIDNCGHTPHLEQSELCSRAILDFCSGAIASEPAALTSAA